MVSKYTLLPEPLFLVTFCKKFTLLDSHNCTNISSLYQVSALDYIHISSMFYFKIETHLISNLFWYDSICFYMELPRPLVKRHYKRPKERKIDIYYWFWLIDMWYQWIDFWCFVCCMLFFDTRLGWLSSYSINQTISSADQGFRYI